MFTKDITKEILIQAGFSEKDDKILREIAVQYGEEYNCFEKTVKDLEDKDVYIEINSVVSNHKNRDWSVHMDNDHRETIASADIQYTWQYNELLHLMGIKPLYFI